MGIKACRKGKKCPIIMNSIELVSKTIRGENPGRTPVYAWLRENLTEQLNEAFGSVEAFEDKYEFDMSHIFGAINPFWGDILSLMEKEEEITPDMLLDLKLSSPDNIDDYNDIAKSIEFYAKDRGRFCYVQTPGFFECYNAVFGIENHLMYLALYPDEIAELYSRQVKWTNTYAEHCIELGAHMIHISDDWGSQNSLMFSPEMFKDLILPYHKQVADFVKSKGAFLSLHSDGCINSVLDDIVDTGFDVIHPYQETANMSYDNYLKNYSDKFGILGGVCVQSTLGFNEYDRLESEIKRVFSLLKGQRFMSCTTHFVQDHCSVEELVFAYDLISKLRQ